MYSIIAFGLGLAFGIIFMLTCVSRNKMLNFIELHVGETFREKINGVTYEIEIRKGED